MLDILSKFPIGILGQVWYLIVSIPDLCTLTYFVNKGIELINLPCVFKAKSVISSIPTYFENKESPIVCYSSISTLNL